MKKRLVLSIVALAIVGLIVGPSLAGSAYGEKPAQPKEIAKPKSVTATVVSVDQQAKTMTVREAGAKADRTFTVEEQQASVLPDLKAGDTVELSYITAEGKHIAKSIKVLKKAKPSA